jgi:hypothetical protein
MVKLVTVQEVRDRMALDPELLGVNNTIASALKAAHLRVETEYDTRLSKGTYTDTFYLDPTMHSGVLPGGMFRLQLRNAFVRQAPLTVTNAFTVLEGFTSPQDAIDGTVTVLDAMRGILFVPEAYSKRFVKVTYEAGFEDAEKDSAPEWLKEAILAYVPVVFNFSNPGNNDPKQEKMNRQSGDHAMAIVAPYRRNIGFCIRPVY